MNVKIEDGTDTQILRVHLSSALIMLESNNPFMFSASAV